MTERKRPRLIEWILLAGMILVICVGLRILKIQERVVTLVMQNCGNSMGPPDEPDELDPSTVAKNKL